MLLDFRATMVICDKVLADIDDITTRSMLEATFVSGLVVSLVASYEVTIEDLFLARANRCGDTEVCSYIKGTLHQRFRSPDLSKIKDTLKRFSKTIHEQFEMEIINTEAHAAWDNLMRGRHAVVHRQGTLNLTLRELHDASQKADLVLQSLRRNLGVS